MKKKYLLGLIPAVLLSSCIGPNWQVDLKRAEQVTKGIVEVQSDEDFKTPENFRYFTETFNLTRKNNGGVKSTYSERNTYTFDIDISKFFFRYEFTQTAHDESDPAKQDTTTVVWYYYDSKTRSIFDVSNLGTLDTRTYKVTVLEEDEEFTDEMFHNHIVEILSGRDQFDYRGDTFIDANETQEKVDALNARDGITCEVKYFSRYEHAFSNQIDTKYEGYINEDGYTVNGNSREIYGWENYYYCSHSLTEDITKEKGNLNIQTVNTLNYELTIFSNKTSVEFDYPDLEKYKLIEDITPGGNE